MFAPKPVVLLVPAADAPKREVPPVREGWVEAVPPNRGCGQHNTHCENKVLTKIATIAYLFLKHILYF